MLDLTRLLPGGLATQLLADLGAEVIKVEEPKAGDYMRAAPPTLEGESYSFMLINQGKKSVALNLKDRQGQDILHRLVPTADVIIEQFRPGVAEKLGIGYDQAKSLREDIVYCSLSGFGATGPYRDRPGHDLNFQALAGLIDMSTTARQAILPSMPTADITSGVFTAYAVLAALLRRERTGLGSYLDIAINDVVAHMNLLNFAEAFAGRDPHQGDTFVTGSLPFYNLYETADGRRISLAAIEEKFWVRFCEVVGKDELKGKHFIIDGDGDVREELRELFASKTLSEWEQLLRDEDVPYAPALTVREATE
ncbi:MAG: CoA transferase, partial [Anaerolineae bacterium]|nr:CoA transferase [Anaerolineae bacterium]NIN95644.1 CoA transferase [Anaerolineae bacterium]